MCPQHQTIMNLPKVRKRVEARGRDLKTTAHRCGGLHWDTAPAPAPPAAPPQTLRPNCLVVLDPPIIAFMGEPWGECRDAQLCHPRCQGRDTASERASPPTWLWPWPKPLDTINPLQEMRCLGHPKSSVPSKRRSAPPRGGGERGPANPLSNLKAQLSLRLSDLPKPRAKVSHACGKCQNVNQKYYKWQTHWLINVPELNRKLFSLNAVSG